MPSSKSHHRNSSPISSDDLFDTYFSEFTVEDFKRVDQAVATANLEKDGALTESDFPPEIDGLNLNLLTEAEWAKLDLPDIEQPIGNNPFGAFVASQTSGLNRCTLTGEESETLEFADFGTPSIPIVFEHCDSPTRTMNTRNLQSPLRQFRRHRVLSVTDLSNPTWCEVQYDYGLRGRRSRPIEKRPVAFKSAAGKVISVKQKVAQKNDIRTKQGLAIHKELQRELRANDLEVKVTTKETQWALRIVNMMACLIELLYGPRNMAREMPVFGIVHDEVVVGVIDEVVCEVSVDRRDRKRKSKDETSDGRPKKRPSCSKSPDVCSDGLIEANDAIWDCKEPTPMYTLHLRDAKTRHWRSIPDDTEALAGRLQLQIYFTLLDNLIAREPPFDFEMLWKKLGVKPDAKLPTKFLAQAQLISENEDAEPISLNALVTSFYELIRDKMMLVSPVLELVYYLRPSAINPKGKGVEKGAIEGDSPSKAVSASREGPPARNNEVGTSRQHGMVQLAAKMPLPQHDSVSEETGIRRFPLIGKKAFVYNKGMTNTHISRVLEWWRGERPPEGVPIHLTSRCRACEYANDCEWRAAKALELRISSGLATTPNILQ